MIKQTIQRTVQRFLVVLLSLGISSQAVAWPGSAVGICDLLLNHSWLVSLSRPLPEYKQDIVGKCGPSSLGLALGYFGKVYELPWTPYKVANEVTAVAVMLAQKKITPSFFQFTTQLLLQQGVPLAAITEELILRVIVNSSDTLVETAQYYGLYATSGTANLAETMRYIGADEVVLVHWLSGGPFDDHWSAIQGVSGQLIELRDPWPTSPSSHIKQLQEFSSRSTTSVPGYFHVVRVSNKPIYF